MRLRAGVMTGRTICSGAKLEQFSFFVTRQHFRQNTCPQPKKYLLFIRLVAYCSTGILANSPASFSRKFIFAGLRRDKSRLYGRSWLCVSGNSFFIACENLVSDEFSAFILMVTQAE
jgi:hypothetical protein